MNRGGSDADFGFVNNYVNFSLGFYAGIQVTQTCSHCDGRTKNKDKDICLRLISKLLISQSKSHDQRKSKRAGSVLCSSRGHGDDWMEMIGWILLLPRANDSACLS